MLTRALAFLAAHPRWTALTAGGISATGFAPLGLWPLTLVAIALLLWLLERVGDNSRVGLPTGKARQKRRAFMLGYLWGVGHFAIGLNWIATAFTFQAAMPAWLGWIAVVLLSLYLAVFPGLAALAAWWGAALLRNASHHPGEGRDPSPVGGASTNLEMGTGLRRGDEVRGGASAPTLPLTLLFAAAWIVTEWLRSWVFTGFAWNPLGAAWLSQGPSADFESAAWLPLVGTYGLSALVIVYAALTPFFLKLVFDLGVAILGAVRSLSWSSWNSLASLRYSVDRKDPDQWLIVALVPMIVIPAWMFGTMFWVMGTTPLRDSSYDARYDGQWDGTPVTIVQPNIDQGDKWDPATRIENFRKLARLSIREDDAAPRLVLWPEAAVPDYLEDGYPPDWLMEPASFTRARLASLLGPDDLLLTGAVKLDVTPDGRDVEYARNSLFVLDAQRRIRGRYDKAHLVPYGEYLPMRVILEPLGLSRLAPGATDFRHGPGPQTLDLGAFGSVGVQICYEIIFSGQVVDRANRPDFIFNPSNDAWFGAWGPPQHLAQARLRAIEEGLPVVRSTPTGISAIIAPDGRVLRSIPMGAAGRIDARLPSAREPTLFARHGNILPLAFAVFLALTGVAIGRRRS